MTPPRVAIVRRAPAVVPMRCFCPVCLALDRAHPGEGYQLAMFPYAVALWPGRGSRP